MKQSCVTKYTGLGVVIAGLVYTYPAGMKSTAFEKSLNEEQKEIWKNIKFERYGVFVVALLVSMLIATNMIRNQIARTLIVLALTMLVYKFWPKSKYMKNHVTAEQLALMKEKPDTMKFYYFVGVLWVVAIAMFCAPV